MYTGAAAQKIDFNHLTVENGLSQNSVLSLAQDGQGFIWIGTRYGLNRYDGTHIKIYKYDPAVKTSISNNYILSLFSDSKKRLWVGTLNGLNLYDPVRDDFTQIILKNDKNADAVRVMNCIYEDRKGNIWIGTNVGLWRKPPGEASLPVSYFPDQNGSGLSGKVIHAIFEDESGLLWIGSDNGLTRMQPSNEGYSITTFRHDQNKNSVSSNLISSIAEDRAHNIWTASIEGGINIFNRETHTFSTLVYPPAGANGLIHKSVRKLLFDQKTGQIWAGTQEGISIIDPASKKAVSYQHDPANQKSLTQNSVHSIFRDRQGITWIGTYFGGVNIAYPTTTAFTTYQNTPSKTSISNNVVSSFEEDEKGNLWIGTEGGGLNYFNRSTNSFTSFKNNQDDPGSLSSNLVKIVYKDKSNRIWIGTHGGYLDLLDPATHTFKHFIQRFSDNPQSNSIAEIGTLLEDSEGNLWTGSNAGLGILKKTNGQWDNVITKAPVSLQPKDTLIKKLFEDAQKNIWIGTSGGLHVYNHATKKLENFFIDGVEGLKSDNINCLQQDSRGNIWVGTYYGGLSVYDAVSKKFTTFTEADGLPNNNIAGMMEDNNGNLWISTSNGLSVMDIEKKKFSNYTSDDGLSGNEFNYDAVFKNENGELFFGGFNGFSSFFPSSIETNNYRAPVVFTGLNLFNVPVAINGPDKLLKQNISAAAPISFQHNQGVFSIEYALLNFIKSNKNKYAYKLKGFDKQWNEVTATTASYTNLPPGNYKFFVKGANNDGIWSKTAEIKINVLPPVWRTWWAYFVYTLIIAAIAFLVIRYFLLQALLKKEDELHQVKLNFFTNISHEIRTHLTLIMAPVDRMLDDKKEDSFSKQQLTAVKNNANRLLKLVSELMDFRKAETDHLQLQVDRFDLILFLQDIYTSFREFSLSKNISISFIHNADQMFTWFDKEQLEKVFFNLLTNAFKFTPEGGRIILAAEQKKNFVTVTVTDNGRGIAPQFIDKLFNNFFQVADHGMQNTGYGIGLALAKQIVTLHKGTITVKSEQATKQKEGHTVFTVTLLNGSEHFNKTGYPEKIPPVNEETEKPIEQMPAKADITADKENHPTILIAEDTAELRVLISEALTGQYNVIECENGLEGWNTAVEQIPDLIISDVMMPEMDGFTFCEKLKTDERTSHIPVILLTAKSAQADQISGLETGADIYLTKPFSTKVLELNVRNLLAARERMRVKFSRQISILPGATDDTAVKSVPDSAEENYVNRIDAAFLDKVMAIIEENMDNPEFGVDMLARKTAMSLPVLYKKLKAVTNMSVNDFVKSLRMKKAAQLLQQKNMTVYEVCYAIGYNDRKYFSKEFKKQFGKSPSEYTGVEE